VGFQEGVAFWAAAEVVAEGVAAEEGEGGGGYWGWGEVGMVGGGGFGFFGGLGSERGLGCCTFFVVAGCVCG